MYKKIPKTINVLIISFIILNTFSFLFFSLAYTPSSAKEAAFQIPDLQIDIFKGFTFSSVSPCPPPDEDKMCVNWIGEHIANIYKYAIGIVGILATVVMMIGGIMWVVAGGNATRIGEAKAWIGAALTGLVLALTSYVILYQINPDLTQFKPIEITQIKESVQDKNKGKWYFSWVADSGEARISSPFINEHDCVDVRKDKLLYLDKTYNKVTQCREEK
ncbi:MAG: pilin [Patescibacteria group bacterium]|nr:pilin [Patescibacteria group bacterium]